MALKNCSAADHHHDEGESPAAKGKIYHFYLVKIHPHEDPDLDSKIKQAQGLIRTINDARFPILLDLKSREEEGRYYRWDPSYWYHEENWYCSEYEARERARELNLLQQSLSKLSVLDDCKKQIRELKCQLVHAERPNRAIERKIFKELQDLERTKELVESDSSRAQEIENIVKRWGSKDEIERRIEELLQIQNKSGWKAICWAGWTEKELKHYRKEKAAHEKDLRALKGKLLELNQKKDKAYERILDSERLQANIRADYDEYVATSNAVKELAMNKDVKGLQELINGANERFMSRWDKEKGFREFYKKRVATSLGTRGLNLDGMFENAGENGEFGD